MAPTRLVCFDVDDLRFRDNPALLDAAATGAPLALGFVWSEELAAGDGGVRGAARVYLAEALKALALKAQNDYGATLCVRTGPSFAGVE